MVSNSQIEEFCGWVNAALSQGIVASEAGQIGVQKSAAAGMGPELIAELESAFLAAYQPSEFINVRIFEADERFEQCLQFLRHEFDEAELDSRDRFVFMLQALHNTTNDHPLVMIGRFARIEGIQKYDDRGNLIHFSYAPHMVSEHLVSVISGNYMSLRPFGKDGVGIGAIGHLVTGERFRRQGHHGTTLLQEFETEIERVAETRDETLQLIALEAQTDSEPFWYGQGFRWPLGTRYAQPPLEFDRLTGQRLHDEVPETLMVKMIHSPRAAAIDGQLLATSVKAMYQNWCLEKVAQFDSGAAQVAIDYVIGKVYQEFLRSLPANSADIPLQPPPAMSQANPVQRT